MEANTNYDSLEKTIGSKGKSVEVGRKVGSTDCPGVTAIEVKVQETVQAGDVGRSGNACTEVTSIRNSPRSVNKIEQGRLAGTQNPVGAKVGTWILNPNTLKKLGIESSVMSALSKQRKAIGKYSLDFLFLRLMY